MNVLVAGVSPEAPRLRARPVAVAAAVPVVVMAAGPAFAQAGGAASAPAFGTAASAAAPLTFRRDAEDPGFPVAGALLLLGLAVVAVFFWWRRVGSPGGSTKAWGLGAASTRSGDVKVLSSTRIDASVRLHVVEWKGRQLLLAVTPAGATVVLDRADAPAPAAPTEAAS